jgi:predicted secreted hydrolase
MNRFLFPVCLLLTVACTTEDQEPEPPAMSVTRTLGNQDTSGYTRAHQVRELTFPADHGAHPGFKNEWWYTTGNLEDDTGQAFGFQFTLFRSALAPPDIPGASRTSAWATRQAFLAHTALSDIKNGEFHHDERYSRGAMGLAGVEVSPFRVWLDDWEIRQASPSAPVCPDCIDTRLKVATDDYELSLRLVGTRPPVLHGDRGLSAKSNTPGNASYYYSYSRLAAEGELTLNGKVHQVTGSAWFDHEWSTSALEEDQSGWDWFSLQLDDGSDLMLFQLRNKTDSKLNYLSGTRIDADGSVHNLANEDFTIDSHSSWTSSHTGAIYPSAWEIRVPGRNMRLSVRSALPDQEMTTSFRYWEGAVVVAGESNGKPVSGKGYAELTGYDR